MARSQVCQPPVGSRDLSDRIAGRLASPNLAVDDQRVVLLSLPLGCQAKIPESPFGFEQVGSSAKQIQVAKGVCNNHVEMQQAAYKQNQTTDLQTYWYSKVSTVWSFTEMSKTSDNRATDPGSFPGSDEPEWRVETKVPGRKPASRLGCQLLEQTP